MRRPQEIFDDACINFYSSEVIDANRSILEIGAFLSTGERLHLSSLTTFCTDCIAAGKKCSDDIRVEAHERLLTVLALVPSAMMPKGSYEEKKLSDTWLKVGDSLAGIWGTGYACSRMILFCYGANDSLRQTTYDKVLADLGQMEGDELGGCVMLLAFANNVACIHHDRDASEAFVEMWKRKNAELFDGNKGRAVHCAEEVLDRIELPNVVNPLREAAMAFLTDKLPAIRHVDSEWGNAIQEIIDREALAQKSHGRTAETNARVTPCQGSAPRYAL